MNNIHITAWLGEILLNETKVRNNEIYSGFLVKHTYLKIKYVRMGDCIKNHG
jgi:hypothetical protein